MPRRPRRSALVPRCCCSAGGNGIATVGAYHYHDEWAVGALLIRVAQRFGVKAVRVSRNCGGGIDPMRRLYKALLNKRLARHGLARTRYFGSAHDAELLLDQLDPDLEIMVHPRLTPRGIVADMEDGEPLVSVVAHLGFRVDESGRVSRQRADTRTQSM